MNKRTLASIVAACGLAAAPAALAQNALVLDGGAIDNIGEAGVVGAGLTPTVVTTVADFQAQIGGGPWQVVVIDVPSLSGSLDTIAADLGDYLDAGGKIIMNYWNLDANPALQGVMDVASETDISSPRGYFQTTVAHPSWGLISGIAAGMDRWGEHGGVMTPASGGVIYGEFDSTGSGDGALIVGNFGRTIMNGHDWDSLDTSGSRRENLVRNQIRNISNKGACEWQDFTWGGPGETVGPFTLKVTQDRDLLKVTDAFIDGDQFEVRIDGALAFTTSKPTDVLDNTTRIDKAYATGVSDLTGLSGGKWSSGAVRLTPGNHTLEIKVIRTATGFPSGGARYQLCSGDEPRVSGGDCVIDYFGDPDGFGTLASVDAADYALWRDQFGGAFFTDYRQADDIAMWPDTDQWRSGPTSWTHNYTVPPSLNRATLRLYFAGAGDSSGGTSRAFNVLVDGSTLATLEFPDAFQHTHVVDIAVPLARIDGSTNFTMDVGGGDGWILDYAALTVCGSGGPDQIVKLGTGRPPASICGQSMTPFGPDTRPTLMDVRTVPSPLCGDIAFSIPMSHRRIGAGWGSWSHGYTGDVYYTNGAASMSTAMPPDTTRFQLYAEPNPFALIEFEVSINGAGGSSSVTEVIDGSSGAAGFGFCDDGGIKSVGVRTTDGTTDFAIGEFAIHSECDDCYADCDGSGTLDFFDFLCFQNAFALGDPYADCDGTGVLDFFDFLCFQNEFAMGCP